MLVVPFLIFIGLPANVANATNRIAILLQNVVSVSGFKQKKILDFKTDSKLLPVSYTHLLWIGIDQASFQESIPAFTESRIRTLRESMDAYLQNDPDYATSLVSYEAKPGAPTIFQEMSEMSKKSGIGPMSAVAGAVASRIGQEDVYKRQV